jgi:outer membrane protein assembly factor BamD
MLSPIYSLDQTDTYKAIDKLQAFIDTYPNSEYLSEANETVGLQKKMRKKYLKTPGIIQYQISSLVALDNFIADYPGTPYKEDALYYKFDSHIN